MNAAFDLDHLYAEIVAGEKRDDGEQLHGSDLISCDYATMLRLSGREELPFDADTQARFMIGHAVEQYVAKYIPAFAKRHGYDASHNVVTEYRGIVGHIDFLLTTADGDKIVIDTTVGGGLPEAKHQHLVKSAFYAVAEGAQRFVEWPFQLGYMGVVKAQKAHWFKTADYVLEVEEAIDRLIMLENAYKTRGEWPVMEPDPRLGYNKCGKPGSGKSYCQSRCPRNAAYAPEEVPV